jgi:hypothetical protein
VRWHEAGPDPIRCVLYYTGEDVLRDRLSKPPEQSMQVEMRAENVDEARRRFAKSLSAAPGSLRFSIRTA